jgi:hypothetical protein
MLEGVVDDLVDKEVGKLLLEVHLTADMIVLEVNLVVRLKVGSMVQVMVHHGEAKTVLGGQGDFTVTYVLRLSEGPLSLPVNFITANGK